MPRLFTRKTKKGKTKYCVQIQFDGQRFFKTFNSVKERAAWIRTMEYKHKVQKSDAIKAKITLRALIEEYIQLELPLKKGSKQMRTFLEFWKNTLGAFKVDEIKAHHIHAAALKKTSVPATYNRYVAHMSIIMSFAYFQDLIEHNPCKKIKKMKETPRDRFLQPEEITRLLEETKKLDHLHLITLIAMTTGARKGEILKMTWENLDLEERSIFIPDTKNGDPKTIFIRPTVWPLLMKWKDENETKSKRIFPIQDFKTSWWSALKRAKIQDFRFHDLRHTFATYLLAQGVSQFDVMKAMGQRNLNSLKVYAHITNTRLKEICSAIDKAFENTEF